MWIIIKRKETKGKEKEVRRQSEGRKERESTGRKEEIRYKGGGIGEGKGKGRSYRGRKE